MLLVSEAYPPGSDLITVPKALPLDDVNVTSLDWCSSEVLSVDPDPDPVEDFLNRFRLLLGDRGQGEGDKDCLGPPSELQFDSPGVKSSALSVELFWVFETD
jgi:hypothetical protein